MVQKEDPDDEVEPAFYSSQRAFEETRILQPRARRVRIRLTNRRRRQVHAMHLAHMRRKQDFGVADSAPQAQQTRRWRMREKTQNPRGHVRSQSADGRP